MTDERAAAGVARGEIVAFGLLTALGAVVLATSFGYGILLEGDRVGPGFMPMVLGALLVLLGGGQLATRVRRPAADRRVPDRQPPEPELPEPELSEADGEGSDALGRTASHRTRQLWMVGAAIVVTLLVIPYLGFLLGFGLMVLFITAVVERRPWPSAVLISVVAAGVVYGVFVVFLNVPMPGGLLGGTAGG
ncbi:MAG: tripartite tricarboxylate transporter TctB family protein [Nocardioidaceae bacterium]